MEDLRCQQETRQSQYQSISETFKSKHEVPLWKGVQYCSLCGKLLNSPDLQGLCLWFLQNYLSNLHAFDISGWLQNRQNISCSKRGGKSFSPQPQFFLQHPPDCVRGRTPGYQVCITFCIGSAGTDQIGYLGWEATPRTRVTDSFTCCKEFMSTARQSLLSCPTRFPLGRYISPSAGVSGDLKIWN